MKCRRISIMILSISLLLGGYPSFAQTAEELLPKAIQLEEVKGELEEAIEVYQKIVERFPDNRPVAAKAQLHIGICYEKLGQQAAQKAYQKVIQEFADQQKIVGEARIRLSRLNQLAGTIPTENIMIRKFIDVKGAGYPIGNPSPDGKYFAFVDWSSPPYGILIKEIGTDKEIRLKNQSDLNHDGDKGSPYDLVWSPDSKQIAYTWENNEYQFCDLRVIEIGNSPPDVLIRVNYFENWVEPLDWSPDGHHILVLFSKKIQNQLGLVSVTDSSFIPLKNLDHSNPTTAKFSPDGRYIAYDLPPNKESDNHDIYVLSIDGKQETRLTSHPSHDFLLDWTPSGKQILFTSDRTGTTDLWSISVDEETLQGKPERITNNVGLIKPMDCTQKGSLYFSTPGAWWDIYSVSINPTTGKIIVPPAEIPLPYQGFNKHPAWSPDGKFLTYVSGHGRGRQQRPNVPCIYSVETGLSKELAYQKDARFPCWFPDSKHILLNGADVVDISTGEIIKVIQLEEDEDDYIASLNISPDGNYIYYVRESRTSELSSINKKDLETGEIKELYRIPDGCLTIALSPDGKQLAVQSRPDKNTRILKLISTITGKEIDLHSYDVNDEYLRYISLAWSPDGRYIYFSKLSDQAELYRIHAAGGDAEKLGVKMHNFTSLSIHPDGQQITFYSFVGLKKHGAIWVMENFLSDTDKTD